MQEYFDHLAKIAVESMDSGVVFFPVGTPSNIKFSYHRTKLIATSTLKEAIDPKNLERIISEKLIKLNFKAGEGQEFLKRKGKKIDEDFPLHWFVTFSIPAPDRSGYRVMYSARAMLLLANAENEIENDLLGAINLIVEAQSALEAGLIASERSRAQELKDYLSYIEDNYGGAIAGVERKRKSDREREQNWEKLVTAVEERCIAQASVADTHSLSYHCYYVSKTAGLTEGQVKTLKNKCSLAGLGKKYFPRTDESTNND